MPVVVTFKYRFTVPEAVPLSAIGTAPVPVAVKLIKSEYVPLDDVACCIFTVTVPEARLNI